MNRKQIETILNNYILIDISTLYGKYSDVNKSKLIFLGDGLIKLTNVADKDIFLNTKDIIEIRGLR